MKFNIGDKVKILDTGKKTGWIDDMQSTIGMSGVVDEYSMHTKEYKVMLTDGRYWWYNEDNLELVNTEETNMNTNEQNYTKDYSLLRKFDLEMVKCGWDMLYNLDGELKDCSYVTHHLSPIEEYVFNIEDHGFIVVGASCANTHHQTLDYVKMKPLAWVEGKPVYKGDVLYYAPRTEVLSGRPCTIKGSVSNIANGLQLEEEREGTFVWTMASNLTWNKPKVKREGWINIYKNGTTYLHDTEEEAAKGSVNFRGQCSPDFVTTIRIEWEE